MNDLIRRETKIVGIAHMPRSSGVYSAHPNYKEQLKVETVPEWAEGYIRYADLLHQGEAVESAIKAADAVRLANALSEITAGCIAEVERSGHFFHRELLMISERFDELGGKLTSPVPPLRHNDGDAYPAPDRRYSSRRELPPALEGVRRNPSAVSRFRELFTRKSAAPEIHQAHHLRELQVTLEKLERFGEVQLKSIRHVIEAVNVVVPAGTFDSSSVTVAAKASAFVALTPEIRKLRSDIEAEVGRTGGSVDTHAYTWYIKWHFVALAVLVLVVLLLIPMMPDDPDAHHTAAVIGCLAVLWITEAMPFFASALLIPLLAVPLGVLPGVGKKETATALLSAMFDHTQILVLGGLCLGKAVAKHQLERHMARFVLRPIANRPWLYLLVMMFASALLCAVISNVAAPVLIMSVVQPSLWELPPESGAPQAILLAVAFSCNFGGMLTPVASPQNAVAQQALGGDNISFVGWVAAAAPIVFIGIVMTWALIILLWRPFREVGYIPIPLVKAASPSSQGAPTAVTYGTPGGGIEGLPSNANATSTHDDPLLTGGTELARSSFRLPTDPVQRARRIEVIVIVAVLFVTVILWCVPEDDVLGDPGVVALIPIVVYFGLGILTKTDFNNLSWHLIFLLSGGNMLGVMSRESHLLEIVIGEMQPFLEEHDTYQVVAVLIACVAVVTTFVSHTVAALLLMPVIVQVSAVNSKLPSSASLVFLSVIMCSGSMAFPITSFPNVNSLLTETSDGKPYLLARHFLAPGLCLSAAVLVQLTTYMVEYTNALFPR
jgi:phosphate transporter